MKTGLSSTIINFIQHRASTVLHRLVALCVLGSLAQWAVAGEMPKVFRDCANCPEMVVMPGKDYAIGKYEVTFDEWDACVSDGGCNGYQPVDGRVGAYPRWGRGRNPVTNVSWEDTQAYIAWLSSKTGKAYRLPNEAEWEFACYGGNRTLYCGGDDLKKVAWFEENSDEHIHPVGEKLANGYGLYDMSGNVWEWVEDCWKGDCKLRVQRGGSWLYPQHLVRAEIRLQFLVKLRSFSYGFRLAQTFPQVNQAGTGRAGE